MVNYNPTELYNCFEERCLCVIVVNVSNLLNFKYITEVYKWLIDFYNAIRNDEVLSTTLEIALIQTNSSSSFVLESTLIENVNIQSWELECGKSTLLPALKDAVHLIEGWYKSDRTIIHFTPFILYITNGENLSQRDCEDIKCLIKDGFDSGKFQFIIIPMKDSNLDGLNKLQPENTPRIIMQKGQKIHSIFNDLPNRQDWLFEYRMFHKN